MRKFVSALLAGSALCAAATGAATAADLPRKAPVAKAPVIVQPVFSWQGFYIGGHVGYGWSDKDWVGPTGLTTSHTADGFIAGGQIGYNWQFAPNWVLGIEGDVSWSDMSGSSTCPNTAFTCRTEVNWLATVAGRLGYSFDRVLVYAKGGGAWVSDDYTASGAAVPTYTASHTRSGWMVGAGIEYAVTQNWSVKAEYNHMDFGSKRTDFTAAGGLTDRFDIDQTVDVFKLGFNYRFGGGPVTARY